MVPGALCAVAVCADLLQCWSVLPSFPIKLLRCKVLLLVALMVSFSPKCTILSQLSIQPEGYYVSIILL